jgi:hypothetical protein
MQNEKYQMTNQSHRFSMSPHHRFSEYYFCNLGVAELALRWEHA